jgi:DNA-binding NarL/FixJ family response regulator
MQQSNAPSRTLLNVAIVDPHPLFRAGFAAVLHQWPHGQVVLQAENGLDYERQCAELGHIHITLVNLDLPKRDGYETIRHIIRTQPRTLPMALAADATPLSIQKALRAGARGILCTTVTPPELFKGLDHMRLAGFHYNHLVCRALHRAVVEEELNPSPDALWASLTPREREVLLLFTSPAVPTLAVVAQRLGIKPDTAETHRKSLVAKLKVHTKAEMVRLVLQYGWG